MTQKRFKKMLMSKGFSRNAVNKIANETAQSGKTYVETYLKINRVLNIDFSCANDAWENTFKKLRKAAQTCAKAMAVLSTEIKKLTRKDD